MLVILEGLVMCFLLLLTCVLLIANGPVGGVVFYEPDVQQRVVKLGLTTEKQIKRRFTAVSAALFLPIFVLIPIMVCGVNGARTFWDIFWQGTAILWIEGLFDRLFIDWYWVGHTKAWVIPGTEDLMPYIPAKTLARKWASTLVGYPLLAALIAAVAQLFI